MEYKSITSHLRYSLVIILLFVAVSSFSKTDLQGRPVDKPSFSDTNIIDRTFYGDLPVTNDLDEKAIYLLVRPLSEFMKSLDSDTSVFEVDYVPEAVDTGSFIFEEGHFPIPMGIFYSNYRYRNGDEREIMEIVGSLTFSQPFCSTNTVKVPSGSFSEWVDVHPDRMRWGIVPYLNLESLVALDTQDEAQRYFLIACGEGKELELLKLRFYGPYLKAERKQIREMFEIAIKIKDQPKISKIDFSRDELLVSSNKWSVLLGLAILESAGAQTATDYGINAALLSDKDMSVLSGIFSIPIHRFSEEKLSEAMCILLRNKDEAAVDAVLDQLIVWSRRNVSGVCTAFSRCKSIYGDMETAIRSRGGNQTERLEKLETIRMQVDAFQRRQLP